MLEDYWYVILFFWGCVFLYRYAQNKKQKQDLAELEQKNDEHFKQIQKQVIENHQERQDFTLYDEDEFWDLVDGIRKKSRGSFKNFNGLLRDKLMTFTPDELIHLDNLIHKLFTERYHHDLFAAGFILFKQVDVRTFDLLMSFFITKGRVFFKQVSLNINLLIGKEVQIDDDRPIFEFIAEAYGRKTGSLIPYITSDSFEIKGEAWEQKDLPSRYPEFWDEFY